MSESVEEEFEKWWTSQCLKMATRGNIKMYLARSIYPADQKVAYRAGFIAGCASGYAVGRSDERKRCAGIAKAEVHRTPYSVNGDSIAYLIEGQEGI